MGVTGLWRLIEPSGKPVPLETLENKVLAVDVSIWLHQAIKGFQDAQGGPLPNAHLLGIYHRVCKLLYFRVKPVFVFDGGVPNLKKETISKRNQQKSKKLSEAEDIQKQLIATLLKHSAINKVLAEKATATLTTKINPPKTTNKEKPDDIYKLPPTEFDSTLSSTDDESTSESLSSSPSKHWDLHTIDEKSPHFKSLPADVRHEILTELKETRKQSSWGRLHELPKQSDDFSVFQMKRLLKRFSVQTSLEEAEKEMGGRSLSLAELETLLKDQGVDTSSNSVGSRIASDENTRYLLIKDVKKAMHEAKKQKELSKVLENIEEVEEIEKVDEEPKSIAEDEIPRQSEKEVENDDKNSIKNQEISVQNDKSQGAINNRDVEFQRDLEAAIQLSLQDVPSTSKESSRETKPKSKHNFSFLEDFDDADFQSSSESEDDSHHHRKNKNVLASAKSYMIEYSGLTPNEIAKIIGSNSSLPKKNKINDVNNITKKLVTEESDICVVTASNSIDEISEKKDSTSEVNEISTEENEDRTVSSSTTNISKSIKIATKITLGDADEVSSSTNREDGESEISNANVNSNEVIEIMSDDASSDASDDFLEVSVKQNTNKEANGLEILIKPEETLEDDIFDDIFSDKKDDINISNSKRIEKNELVTEEVKPSVEPEVLNSLKLSSQPQDNDLNKKIQFSEGLTESKELTKEERTKNIIAEFINPLQQPENFKISKEDEPDVQKTVKNGVLTTEQLEVIEENLRQEKAELTAGRSSKERMASSLTDQIYQDAQELLQLFGVPFIVAPMEAEAQCAFLNDVNLTDGTITDDSDIWLFGGKTVYKNFFNQHKHVMEFRAENIQHHFKLTREQMVLLALLVGSDYTVGIQGIGPVTALEVLAAFPPSKTAEIKLTHQQLISGLGEFRKWLTGERAVGPGRTALRNKLKNVTFTDSFPSLQVIKAYLEPTVDNSKEPFSWAKPDIVGLTEFARQKFGWTRVKSEEILKPVVKRLNENRIQKSIKDFFQTKHKIDSGETENKMSKRVKKAVSRIGREHNDNSDEEKKKPKVNRKRNQKSKKVAKSIKEVNIETTEDIAKATDDIAKTTDDIAKTTDDVGELAAGLSSDEDIQILKKTRVQSKKKIQQIKSDVKKEIEQQQVVKKPRTIASIHKKEVIPQKERDKVDALRSKMKAIEVFRKSKKGPGFVKKRKVVSQKPKEDAELSESSSD